MSLRKLVLWLLVLLYLPVTVAGNTIVLKSKELTDLVGVSSFIVNSKGEIFLFSPRVAKVFKFKPDGTFEKSFCQKGQGPGDIARVFVMYLNPANDYLYLPEYFSMAKGKITIYDSKGNFVDLLKPELSINDMDRVAMIIFLKDNSYIIRTSDRVDWKPAGKFFITQVEELIRYFGPDGKLKAQIFKTCLDSELSNAVRWGGPTIPFTPSLAINLTPEEQIAIAKTDENFISFYDRSGKKVRTITLAIPREKLGDKEFEKAKELKIEEIKHYNDERMLMLAKNMIRLEYKPIFKMQFFTPDYIVLSRIIEEDESGYTRKTQLMFFDWQGRKKGEKVIAGRVVNREKDLAMIIAYDDDGNESYRIEPGVFSLDTGKK